MENFILYLGKASVLLAIFFLAYYFLLRKETFFSSNRWFLLMGILTSLVLPLVIFTKIIWVEPIPIQEFASEINRTQLPENFIPTEETGFEINWFYVAIGIYLSGVLFFFGRFARDFKSLKKILEAEKAEKLGKFKFIDTNKIQSPFSFFNYIIFNSKIFKGEELENIIAHEKVHSVQFHSADMIFSQLFCIAFWFNPIAWLYKKAIAQNLEFIADANALKIVSDRITYQKTLLKVVAPHHCIPVTNHFYQSLIKKRIVMLNKNQSKRRNSWKYATVFPLLAIFMFQFQVETEAKTREDVDQETQIAHVENSKNPDAKADALMILNTTTDKELGEYISKFCQDNSVKITYKGVKRDKNNEIIEITLIYDDNNGTSGQTKFVNSGKPIASILFTIKKDANGKNSLIINDLGTKAITVNDESSTAYAVATEYISSNKDTVVVSNSSENELVTISYAKPKESSLGYSMSFKTSSSEDVIKNTLNNPSIDASKALIFINGKQVSRADFEKVNQDDISNVSVISKKSPSFGKFAEKYGEKASNGLIYLETNRGKTIAYGYDGEKEAKLINDNSGFVIDKKSRDSDLEFYKSSLSKSNIALKYKAKRNDNNEIKSITIEISEKIGGKKQVITRQWKFDNDAEVIPEIFVGKSNGNLIVSVNNDHRTGDLESSRREFLGKRIAYLERAKKLKEMGLSENRGMVGREDLENKRAELEAKRGALLERRNELIAKRDAEKAAMLEKKEKFKQEYLEKTESKK
ncbi:M56 family metallopeptidase [uncultured Flavobacterium sp.]|uniref:M56 family metallopeptidase n=1 Tax=uncultured Flavobacterium sp. TaxID=165435 RepID=UPI0025FB5DE9|nr:M56 family metallopeptidase [uncultured Flavobacterium sp.]